MHKEWVTWLRDSDGAHSQQKIDTRARELCLRELEWSSPPHLTPWKTPVPAEYFQRAAGGSNTWCLLRLIHDDLVPNEQPDLCQDVCDLPALHDTISSAEARSCISLCRQFGN